jgi:hypothetical protein
MSSSFKQLNPGPLSAMRGAEVIAFSFRVNGSSDPDFLWQAGADAVTSVVRASSGVFTVQFHKAYPRQIVGYGGPSVLQAHATDTIEGARYVVDSYSTTTGQLTVETITDDGDGTLTVEDITDNSVVSCVLYVQRVNALVEDES